MWHFLPHKRFLIVYIAPYMIHYISLILIDIFYKIFFVKKVSGFRPSFL